jgi:hypothetical protein
MAQTQVTPTPLPANLANILLDKAANAAVSPTGVDMQTANRTVSLGLQTVAQQAAPGTDLPNAFATASVTTLDQDTRTLAARIERWRATQPDPMVGPALATSEVTRRPGTAASGALSMEAFLAAGQIFVSTQLASKSQASGAARFTTGLPPRGYDETAHLSPGSLLALRFKPVDEQPIIRPDIQGVTPAMKSARNQAEATVVAPPLTRHPRSSSQGPQLGMMPSPSAPA